MPYEHPSSNPRQLTIFGFDDADDLRSSAMDVRRTEMAGRAEVGKEFWRDCPLAERHEGEGSDRQETPR